MFDIGFSEIILIAIAALIAIGPQELPDVLFRLGRFVRQVKMFTNGIRNQYADIMHDAELDHYRKQLNATGQQQVTAQPEKPVETLDVSNPS